jgi:hypothetical protein
MIKDYWFGLYSPPEKTYRKGDIFQGWRGEEGVIQHITEQFGLDKTQAKQGSTE